MVNYNIIIEFIIKQIWWTVYIQTKKKYVAVGLGEPYGEDKHNNFPFYDLVKTQGFIQHNREKTIQPKVFCRSSLRTWNIVVNGLYVKHKNNTQNSSGSSLLSPYACDIL